MTEILPFLKKLISAPGLSGHETPVRKIIEETWTPLCDEVSVSRLGSLHGLHRGTAPEPRPSIRLAAHMDAIGLMVTRIVDGFLYITDVGGVDARVLPGQVVTVHGREDLPGIVVQPPPRLLPEGFQDGPVPMDLLLVDTGLHPERVTQLVRPGDLISFAQPPLETNDETLAGHSLDNRHLLWEKFEELRMKASKVSLAFAFSKYGITPKDEPSEDMYRQMFHVALSEVETYI